MNGSRARPGAPSACARHVTIVRVRVTDPTSALQWHWQLTLGNYLHGHDLPSSLALLASQLRVLTRSANRVVVFQTLDEIGGHNAWKLLLFHEYKNIYNEIVKIIFTLLYKNFCCEMIQVLFFYSLGFSFRSFISLIARNGTFTPPDFWHFYVVFLRFFKHYMVLKCVKINDVWLFQEFCNFFTLVF